MAKEKIEDMLKANADRHWPGSTHHVLAVWAFLKNAYRGSGIGAAMLINIALTNGGKTRREAVEAMGSKITDITTKAGGGRRELQDAAVLAVDALRSLAVE